MEDVSEPKRNPLTRASSESSTDPACCMSPGDTLPWNLPKHQRMKRSKSASGEVLDPAERAVIRIAGMEAPALNLKQDFILRSGSCQWFPLEGPVRGSCQWFLSSSPVLSLDLSVSIISEVNR